MDKRGLKEGWVASFRKTKDMPNVYSLKQLQTIATLRGKSYSGVNKKNLAELLGIKWVNPWDTLSDKESKKKTPQTKSKTVGEAVAAQKKKQQAKTKGDPKQKGETKKKGETKTKGEPKKKGEGKKKEIENPIYIAGKGCNIGRFPNALSKEVVAELAMKYLEYTKSQTVSKTKDQLCVELSKIKGIELPSADSSKTPKQKKTARTTKKTTQEEKNEWLKKEEAERLTKDIKEAAKKAKLSKTAPTSLSSSCIDKSKLKLHPYQTKAVNHIRKHRGAVLAFEVGAGKTLTAVAAAQCALSDGSVDKIIVSAPPQLLNNMKDTLDKFGVRSKDKKKYSFFSIPMFAKEFGGTNIKSFPKRAMLIVDEAHKLKKNLNPAKKYGNVKTDTTAARVAIECAKKAEKVVLLTGTPISNKPVDVVNLAAMVRGETELTEAQFHELVKNPKAFNDYMKCIFEFYENPKSDDYPSVKVHTVNLVMDKEYYKKYMKVEKKELDAKGMVSKSGELKAAFYSNVRQATNSFTPNPKIKEAMKIIEKGKKTLIYSAYKDAGINKLKSELESRKIPFVFIDGSMTVANREKSKDKINDPKSGVNVLLITQAASVGLDLKGIRNVILLEKGWKSSDEEQIIGRAVRYKSHTHLPEKQRRVDVWHLVLKKPTPADRKKYYGKEDNNLSADEILEKKIKEKDQENIPFAKRLRETAVGKSKNCTMVSKLKILEELKRGKK